MKSFPKTLKHDYKPKGLVPTGRPATGEVRYCAICNKEIYVRASRLKKNPNWGILCQDCRDAYQTISADHCPRCKGNLIEDEDENERRCFQCSRHWPSRTAMDRAIERIRQEYKEKMQEGKTERVPFEAALAEAEMGQKKGKKRPFEKSDLEAIPKAATKPLEKDKERETRYENVEELELIIPEWKVVGSRVKSQFYEKHIAEIVADLERLGQKGMKAKWGMSPSGWIQIRERWIKHGIKVEDPSRRGPYKEKVFVPNPEKAIEGEINPEEVWGKWFRIPSIEGHGSGAGFGFQNLNLPRRWEESLSTLNHLYFRQQFEQYAHNVAGRFGLTIQTIFWDEKTGILSSVNIKEGNACGIYLERDFPRTEEGGYHGHNVDRLDQAHCLFSIIARFINEILDRIYGIR